MPHLQDSMNKSPVWGTMQNQCDYIPTPTRLDKQVASMGDYATLMPLHTHLQDSLNKSPGWTTRNINAITYPHLQDSTNMSTMWGTIKTNATTYVPTFTRLDKLVGNEGDYTDPYVPIQDQVRLRTVQPHNYEPQSYGPQAVKHLPHPNTVNSKYNCKT